MQVVFAFFINRWQVRDHTWNPEDEPRFRRGVFAAFRFVDAGGLEVELTRGDDFRPGEMTGLSASGGNMRRRMKKGKDFCYEKSLPFKVPETGLEPALPVKATRLSTWRVCHYLTGI